MEIGFDTGKGTGANREIISYETADDRAAIIDLDVKIGIVEEVFHVVRDTQIVVTSRNASVSLRLGSGGKSDGGNRSADGKSNFLHFESTLTVTAERLQSQQVAASPRTAFGAMNAKSKSTQT